MSRTIIAQEFDVILEVVASHPGGIGLSGLHETFFARSGSINRRTLQRRLACLVQGGRLVREGRIYKCRVPIRTVASDASRRIMEPGAAYDADLPVSAEGREVRDLVREPLAHRGPIGYDRKFLENYEPGSSRYLPDALRFHLHEIGRTAAAGQPAGVYARSILARLRVDLSWASSRLEGCAYTRSDALALIESGKAATDRNALEARILLGHKTAIEMLVENAEKAGIDAPTLQGLYAVLSRNSRRAGAARRPGDASPGVSPVPRFIESRFHLFIEKAAAITDPFEQAFFLLVQLPYLQAFADANRPVSRLAANIPLLRHNLRPLSFVDVPMLAYMEGTLGVYELRRIELLRDVFAWAYETSCVNFPY